MGLHPDSQRGRVLAVIEEGPATSPEVAAETGLPVKHCNAHLRALWQVGVLTRVPGPRNGGRPAHIYRLATGEPPCTTT